MKHLGEGDHIIQTNEKKRRFGCCIGFIDDSVKKKWFEFLSGELVHKMMVSPVRNTN